MESAAYHVAKVARILKISRPLTLRLIRSGELPATRTPLGLRVQAESLYQWVDRQLAGPWEAEPSLAKASVKRLR